MPTLSPTPLSDEEIRALHTTITLEHLAEKLSASSFEAVTAPCSLRLSVYADACVHASSCPESQGLDEDTTAPEFSSTLVDLFAAWDGKRLIAHRCLPEAVELWGLWSQVRTGAATVRELRTEATALAWARDLIARERTVPAFLEILELLHDPAPGAPPTLRELHREVSDLLGAALAPLSAEEVVALLPTPQGRGVSRVFPDGAGRAPAGPLSVMVVEGCTATLLRLWAGGTRHGELVLLVLPTPEVVGLYQALQKVEYSAYPVAAVPELGGSVDWVRSPAPSRLILESYREATEHMYWTREADRVALEQAVQLAAEVFTP